MSVVVNWYRQKTRQILEKYGPGPRVHYHMGIVGEESQASSDQAVLQRQMTQSQDDMMLRASEFWGVGDLRGKRVLDVGAGLGGPALWMARHRGATVDALVQFPDHANLIRSFATLSGLSQKVRPVQGDAHRFRPRDGGKYDFIYAMESPCYFRRDEWFAHLDTLLVEGGEIWVEDALLGPAPPADAKPTFDAYWKTDVGDVAGYLAAAKASGFEGRTLDLTAETAEFWKLSAHWIQRKRAHTTDEATLQRLQRSYDSAMYHYDYWCQGYFQIGLFAFRRAG